MLLVYTHKITPRLKYIFRHICVRILQIPVDFTTEIETFIAHTGLKMSYTKKALSNEIHIKNHSILFDSGLDDLELEIQTWGDTKCFFPIGEKSSLAFDIFAASFFMLSRYEEYLPHVKDKYGRFSAKESLGYKEGFLHQPVVDIWAYKFRDLLIETYPDYEFKPRKYQVKPVIDVPLAFNYKHKGLLRTFGNSVVDIVRLKFKTLYQRYRVLSGFVRDPYDTFKWIITKQKQHKNKFTVFFLIGDYSTYDKNTSINKKKFVSLIKSVGDYCKIGLKISYMALDNIETLKMEKRRMEDIINQDLLASRNSFSKVNLPETYRHLTELEVKQDFTMGFIGELGFRAGTCTPFLFYDLDYEIQTPLQIHPYHMVDSALLKHISFLDKKEVLERLIQSIKKVDGTFTPIFHNYTFSNEPSWTGFKKLFDLILKSSDEDEQD